MKPIEFKDQNATFAKDQPEYLPLPALKVNDKQGTVISCWKMGLWERLVVLFTGRVWLDVYTFDKPLQPQRMSVLKPYVYNEAPHN